VTLATRGRRVWERARLSRDRAVVTVSAGVLALAALTRPSKSALHRIVAIDAGEVGWTLIEYQELLRSAREYFGREQVIKIVITNRDRFGQQVRAQLAGRPVSLYVFDPRSLSESAIRSWMQTVGIALWLARHRITPIARLTDVPVRRWRLQTALVTARTGTCSLLMQPERAARWCAHKSLVGPLPMPLSQQTAKELARVSRETLVETGSVVFVGSLYEPRTTFLRELSRSLQQHEVQLVLKTRSEGGKRIPDEEYWQTLARADVIVTTADQTFGPGVDRIAEPHLIYRYLEACAVGRPLVAQIVPGSQHLFEPGSHYVPFDGVDSATEAILTLLDDKERRQRLSEETLQRAELIASSNQFWAQVDLALKARLTSNQ